MRHRHPRTIKLLGPIPLAIIIFSSFSTTYIIVKHDKKRIRFCDKGD
jgi:hypothetical protein